VSVTDALGATRTTVVADAGRVYGWAFGLPKKFGLGNSGILSFGF
jgi:hypothetical protein